LFGLFFLVVAVPVVCAWHPDFMAKTGENDLATAQTYLATDHLKFAIPKL
jgi:hypothetical protein